MTLLFALPHLKKKLEQTPCLELFEEGYNQCLDDLAKYELCEEELANSIPIRLYLGTNGKLHTTKEKSDTPIVCYLTHDTCLKITKSIISSSHLWIKRKES